MLESLIARALVAQFLTELLERARDEPLRYLVTSDFRMHAGAPSDLRGPNALRPFLDGVRAAFDSPRLQVEDLLAEGDRVAARFVFEADHAGTSAGVVPAGRRVRLHGMLMARVRAGKVAEAWLEQDRLAFV